MKTNIKDKNNFITSYGLACGYIETRETDFVNLQLHKEHSVYMVSYNNYISKETEVKGYYTYSEAKKRFFELCKKLNFKKYK